MASPLRTGLGLVGWLVVSFVAAAIGAVASIQAQSFYSQLVQPSWAPPAWLFGPVWTALYICMAIAAWLVWRSGGIRGNRGALSLFVVQLALNALWTWLFFAWHRGAWASADSGLIAWLRDSSCKSASRRGLRKVAVFTGRRS